jgi:hypothetical protein
MRFFFLTLRKRGTNVVSDFYVFVFSVTGFLRAFNVAHTLARIPLKTKAVINGLMPAFFVKEPAFFFGKQNRTLLLIFCHTYFHHLPLKNLS